MGYLYISIAVIMFGVQFFFNGKYGDRMGNGLSSTVILCFLSALGGGVCLFTISLIRFGLRLEFTWFTLLMASLAAANFFAYTACSLKSLSKINLSLYLFLIPVIRLPNLIYWSGFFMEPNFSAVS